MNEREISNSHPPPLAGGGAMSRKRHRGGWNGVGVRKQNEVRRECTTPRDRAVARSHPPPQAAEGEKNLTNAAANCKVAHGKKRAVATAAAKRAAVRLRQTQTDAETILWAHLRNRRLGGFNFRRQHPIGRYVADFACPSASLIVEADGGQHNGKTEDLRRDDFLRGAGWRILRVWDDDVLQKTDGVLSAILSAAQSGIKQKEEKNE